jgi:hypothetical protein
MANFGKKKKKAIPEFDLQRVLDDDVQQKMLLGFIEEIVLVFEQNRRNKEALKDIRDQAKIDMGITPKLLMKLAKLKSGDINLEASEQELEDLRTLLEALEGA